MFLLDLNQLHFVQRHNALKYIPQLLEFTFQPFSSISFHFEPSERHIPVLNRMIYGITPILETSLISELSKLVKKHFLTLQPAFKILSWLFFSKWINKIKCHISSRGAPVTGRFCASSRSIAAPSLLQGPRLIMMLMRISWRESRMGGFLGKHDFGRKIHAQSWAWIGAAAQFLNWNQSLIISQSSARIPAPEWKILISWALSHLPWLHNCYQSWVLMGSVMRAVMGTVKELVMGSVLGSAPSDQS